MTEANGSCIASALDDLMEEDGMLVESEAIAVKRVLAWQIDQAMTEARLGKTEMARRMNTSRAALDRLLDSENPSATLMTMHKAAAALGKRIKVELVDEVA